MSLRCAPKRDTGRRTARWRADGPATDVVWSRAARAELLSLDRHVAQHHGPAAERLLTRMEWRTSRLADQPRLGRRRPEITHSTRVLVEATYPILSETHPDIDQGPIIAVAIFGIVDRRRDRPAAP